jgi:arylformamidase
VPVFDLTMPLSASTIPVPGHPCPTFTPLHALEQDGIRNTVMAMSLHTGTHVDAPAHIVPDGAAIDEIPCDRFERRGTRLDLRARMRPETPLTLADLAAAGFDPSGLAGAIVVLNTGWADENLDRPALYGRNPYLALEAAQALAAAGPSAVALDFAIDHARPWRNHQVLLGAGIPLIENLVGLHRLPGSGFTIAAFPLRVVGGNGAPARAVARVSP